MRLEMSFCEGALERSEWVGEEAGVRRKRSPNECWQSLGRCGYRAGGGVQYPSARAGVSAVSFQAESNAELYRVGLLESLQDWNCSGTHPLVAGRDKSQHKPVWPLFLCSLVCLAYSFVFSEHPSLGCITCAFLHLALSSFSLCSAWICSVYLANSKTSPYFNLVLSVFGLYLNSGLYSTLSR